MKLFQKLLLAPAALGLMAPVAASAADLNIAGVSQYGADSAEQVTSITQFSDVKPTDWAYQALSNLIERYGCVAGYPDGTYRGGRAMTRYEAAALLNACLDRITEVTDELKRLMKEFEKELAVLKGRVDGLEAKVGELEATQFSTTTKLRADTRWVLGGQTFGGNINTARNSFTQDRPVGTGRNSTTALRNGLSFNYDVRLNFDTSFTGKDLLRTQLRAGNFADSAFGQNPTTLSKLDAGFEEGCGTGTDCGDVVAINRLYYKFPVGSNITVVGGPRVRQDDMLAVWPSVYTGDKILKFFQFAGSPVANSQVLGAGAGFWWKEGKKGWSFGANYVAGNGDNGNSAQGGIGNGNSAASGSAQLAYTGKNWNLTGLYTYNNAGVSITGTPFATNAVSNAGGGGTNAFNLAGYWQPMNSGWVPSISAGWGIATSNNVNGITSSPALPVYHSGIQQTTQSWMVGLNWKDAFLKGNVLGMAVGQGTFVSATDNTNTDLGPWDGNYVWEWFYKFQVSDNIAVTPSIFYLSRPQGEYTGNGRAFDSFGYLLQTTFKF
jgi:hypothetical protein